MRGMLLILGDLSSLEGGLILGSCEMMVRTAIKDGSIQYAIDNNAKHVHHDQTFLHYSPGMPCQPYLAWNRKVPVLRHHVLEAARLHRFPKWRSGGQRNE